MKLKLEIIGNLGSDAVVRDVNNSKAIGFSVAHSEKYKNSQGTEVENTTWINCTIWKYQDQSVEIAKYLKKGTMVAIEGFPSVKGYQNQQGQIGASMECRVSFIKLLSNKNIANDNAPQKTTSTQINPNDNLSDNIVEDDGLPF